VAAFSKFNIKLNSIGSALPPGDRTPAVKQQSGFVVSTAETGEQRDFLRAIHCDEMQGYFFSKPDLPAEFKKFIDPEIEDPALDAT
jgi:hypothetical protein